MPKSYQELINESLKEVALRKKSYENLVSSARSTQSVPNVHLASQTSSEQPLSTAFSAASTIYRIPGCPEPGRLQYRHDPVKTHLHYEKVWRDQPAPGDKTHDKLRWEVRKSLIMSSPLLDPANSWQDTHSTAPFVISGVWPTREWTNDDLIKSLPGKFPVRIGSRRLEIGKPKYDNACEQVQLTVDEFIDWTTSPGSSSDLPSIDTNWGYMDYLHLVEHDLDSACSSFPFASLLGRDYDDIQPTVWLGTTGAHSPLHYDTMGWNLHVQLRGSKQWILVPPGGPTEQDRLNRQKSLGATRTPYENTTVYSEFDALGDPSILSCIEGVRVFTLLSGDILFVPPLWWHAVCCVDEHSNSSALSFSCNIWLSERPDIANTVVEVATALKLDESAEMREALEVMLDECMQWFTGELFDESSPIVQNLIELTNRGRSRYDDFVDRYKHFAAAPISTVIELAKINRSKMCLSFVPLGDAAAARDHVRPWEILQWIIDEY